MIYHTVDWAGSQDKLFRRSEESDAGLFREEWFKKTIAALRPDADKAGDNNVHGTGQMTAVGLDLLSWPGVLLLFY
ncbi:hypothetical protein KL86CLO1_12474 [uncultured Eubacteriales bacterium]|uniref:Uncharacterized protein n=1 Tax=uncultured Eubacteriales bacterium TaxID=172733 RepID=A0A212KA55_9FIRM|nr:hypothetical protein KL86CLO1_12474 [uncultured Eubacteriales bacterium]